jgi:hypothetical protein
LTGEKQEVDCLLSVRSLLLKIDKFFAQTLSISSSNQTVAVYIIRERDYTRDEISFRQIFGFFQLIFYPLSALKKQLTIRFSALIPPLTIPNHKNSHENPFSDSSTTQLPSNFLFIESHVFIHVHYVHFMDYQFN